MKIIIYLVLFVLVISKPVMANNEERTKNLDSLAEELFRLFIEQKYDSLITKYFLSYENSKRFEDIILPNKKNENINYEYDSILTLMKNELKQEILIAIDHNINLERLRIKSVKSISVDNDLFKEDYRDKLLYFEITCTDKNKNYSLTIGPLVRANNQWMVYLTEFRLKQE